MWILLLPLEWAPVRRHRRLSVIRKTLAKWGERNWQSSEAASSHVNCRVRTDPRKPSNYKTYFRGYSKALEFHPKPSKTLELNVWIFRVSGQCPVVCMYMKWMSINWCLCVSDIEMINIHQKPTHWALDCTGNPYHIITTTAAQPSSVTAPVIGHCSCLYAVSESATTYQLLGLVLVMA